MTSMTSITSMTSVIQLPRLSTTMRWMGAATATGLVAAAICLLPAQGVCAEPATPARALLEQSKRVVVLGDSITYGGRWVAILNAWMESQGMTAEVIDVGLSSETVSGLSEEGHAEGKFPRPDLAERLDRVLRITRPDLVIACYGMNCGIYQPLDEGRFAKFRDGMETV